jgi:hypothetical protein
MDVADMDAVMAAIETPAVAEAMEYDGVLPETLVILVEAWVLWQGHEGSARPDRAPWGWCSRVRGARVSGDRLATRPSAFGYVRAKLSQHSRTMASCSCPDCDGARGGKGRRRTLTLRRHIRP